MKKYPSRKLQVFLSYASEDDDKVMDFASRLRKHNVDVWRDKDKLLPGQQWEEEIDRAFDKADIVILLLSKKSVNKEGYVQLEFSMALEKSKRKPSGTIYLIPALLNKCEIPSKFSKFEFLHLYKKGDYQRLLLSLSKRALSLADKGVSPIILKEEGTLPPDFMQIEDGLDKMSPHQLSLIYTVLSPEDTSPPVRKTKLLEYIKKKLVSTEELSKLKKVAEALEMTDILNRIRASKLTID